METEKKLYFCLENLRKKTNFRPEIALILGSGLGDYGDTLKIETIVNYNERGTGCCNAGPCPLL